MRTLNNPSCLSWLCIGDMNEIHNHNKKIRGQPRSNSQIADFRNALNHHNFIELGFKGPKFTWKRGNHQHLIAKRLDRAVATEGWLYLFPKFIL